MRVKVETQSIPAKWRKYLKLVEFGLVELKEIEHDIHRFSWSERFSIIDQIQNDIDGQNFVDSHLYVVKFVPLELTAQLPNVRMESPLELQALEARLTQSTGKFVEVWYCRTPISKNTFSVAGRLAITPRMATQSQSLEQVWNCSPRLIESYGKNFPYPYARASRPNWGWRFQVQEVYVPNQSDILTQQLNEEFSQSVRALERLRDLLEPFFDYFEHLQLGCYSIEYKIVGSRIYVIDWDSSDDSKVIS